MRRNLGSVQEKPISSQYFAKEGETEVFK